MNDILFQLSGLMRSGGPLIPIIAILGGFLTSLTPCSLSALPFVIAYIGGGEEVSKKKNFSLSLIYAAGNALAFIAMGLVASLLGKLVNFTGPWWYYLLGAIMVLFSLDQFGLINLTKKFTKLGQKVKRNRFGALVFGIISGVFASPCATPVLTALIAMIATAQMSVAKGIGLFALFALGNAITIVTVGVLSGRVSIIKKEGYGTFAKIIQYGFAILILTFGIFLIMEGVKA